MISLRTLQNVIQAKKSRCTDTLGNQRERPPFGGQKHTFMKEKYRDYTEKSVAFEHVLSYISGNSLVHVIITMLRILDF